jgi:hypothetical protein
MKLRGFAALGLALSAGCADSLVGPGASTDHGAVFDDAWRTIDLHYSYFDYNHINWDSIGGVYRPRAVAASGDAAFARVLGQMLAELHDMHVVLNATGERPIRYISRTDSVPSFYSAAATAAHYLTGQGTSSGGHVTFGMLSPTVGYVRLASLVDEGWASELDEALAAMPAARAMVVDLRGNPGGNRGLAIDLAGRFANASRTFGYIKLRNGPSHSDFSDFITETVDPSGPRQFSGSLYVLTDRHDYSSAEELVMALRVQPNATVVGDTTGGASGGPVVHDLPNGWTYEISEWIEYTPQRVIFEGVGLPPDVVIKITSADALAGRDPVVAQALALAQARPGS